MPIPAESTTDVATVRLLINDIDEASYLFSDDEVLTFLTLEGNIVKLAAAQAIDTIADNEALVSKVIKDRNLSTDGPKVADSLRKRAAVLRAQAAADADASDDGAFFEIGAFNGPASGPELTGTSWPW